MGGFGFLFGPCLNSRACGGVGGVGIIIIIRDNIMIFQGELGGLLEDGGVLLLHVVDG